MIDVKPPVVLVTAYKDFKSSEELLGQPCLIDGKFKPLNDYTVENSG